MGENVRLAAPKAWKKANSVTGAASSWKALRLSPPSRKVIAVIFPSASFAVMAPASASSMNGVYVEYAENPTPENPNSSFQFNRSRKNVLSASWAMKAPLNLWPWELMTMAEKAIWGSSAGAKPTNQS